MTGTDDIFVMLMKNLCGMYGFPNGQKLVLMVMTDDKFSKEFMWNAWIIL